MTTPTRIAMVRSNTMVATMVAKNSSIAPLNLWENIYRMEFHSFILHAVTMRTPARAAMGIWLMTGANRNMEIKSPTAWNIPVRRVFAPERMATLVRAMAAVAGMPPKKGSRMLPTPWAMSS